MAEQMAAWSGIPFVALRFSNIMSLADYTRFPSWQDDPHARKWNLWGYIDQRDVALSCRLALEANTGAVTGNPAFIIAAADTVMNRPSRDLMAEVFPAVPYRPTEGDFDSLLSTRKAHKLLGYEPKWSWRDHIAGT